MLYNIILIFYQNETEGKDNFIGRLLSFRSLYKLLISAMENRDPQKIIIKKIVIDNR